MNTKVKIRMLSLLLCLVLVVGLMPTTVFAVTEIHQANITITKPVGGENPDISPVSSESEKYYADVDTWVWMYGGSGTPVGDGGTFKTHELYALRVIFHAKPGYTFTDDCVYTINGKTTGCYGIDANEFRYIYCYAADPQNPTYSVSFDADGGSGTMADVTDVFADYKLPACTFTAPSGKYFSGWFVGGYMKDPGESILVFKDTNVLACWKNIPTPGSGYSVTYNGGAECGGSMDGENKTDYYGELTLPACGFTPPSGKRFVCWRVGNSSWNPGDKIIINFNTTVNAIWEDIPQQPDTYTVTFDSNGGTGTMADVTGISGVYTLPANGFTAPNGKQFKAWSVGGVEKAVGDKITVTANTTVTAVWKSIEYNITGTVTSFNDDSDDIMLHLIPEGFSEVAYETIVKGNTVDYYFPDVATGTYTLKVMKENHIAREYKINVGSEPVILNAKISRLGDVNMDGKISVLDAIMVQKAALTLMSLDDYRSELASVRGKSSLGVLDAILIQKYALGLIDKF